MLDLLDDIRNVQGVIHVGANDGAEVRAYRRRGVRSICCIEPLEAAFRHLVATHGQAITAINCAAGSKNEFKRLFVASNRGHSSSTLRPSKHLKCYPRVRFGQELEVPVRRLQDLPIKFANFDLLVLDVQGAEFDVLKGAGNSLGGFQNLILEVYREELYENVAHIDDIEVWLEERGFRLKTAAWRRPEWGDAHFERVTATVQRNVGVLHDIQEVMASKTFGSGSYPRLPMFRAQLSRTTESGETNSWMPRVDLEAIVDVARGTDGDIIEVGCGEGRTTRVLADLFRNRTVWAIDFCANPNLPRAQNLQRPSPARICIEARHLPNVRILDNDSARCLEAMSAGFILIDGDHSLGGVIADSRAAAACIERVAGRRAIVWHDYRCDREWIGVARFLECLQEDLPIFHIADTMVAFLKCE